MADVKMEASWKHALAAEFDKPYFEKIVSFLKAEKQAGKTVYPAGADIFAAFSLCPILDTKVVILGQDPYHNPGQAHGLSFSVRDGVGLPPSLRNIFKELQDDLGVTPPATGNLSAWAQQGVLLLNATLTVDAAGANTHSHIGWQTFTDAVIKTVSDRQAHVVFVLWGKYAQSKTPLIDTRKHLIVASAHPSPLSAHNGFFGSKPFSKANAFLQQHHIAPIDWRL